MDSELCTIGEEQRSKDSHTIVDGKWVKKVCNVTPGAEELSSQAATSGLTLSDTLFLTVGSTAVGINDAAGFAGLDGTEVRAVIQVQDQTIRFRLDGVAPTSSEGECADPKTYIELGLINTVELNQPHAELANFIAIATTGTAVLAIRLYK